MKHPTNDAPSALARPSRRELLSALGALGAVALHGRLASACGCQETTPDIEGPYYLPGAPTRSVLREPGMEGAPLELQGLVTLASCEPLANAVLEFWQADAAGRYDVRGMRLRGALTTDREGRFGLQTIVPGRYLNGDRYRPAHLHVKVRAPRGRALTTQLYFDGDPYNVGDPWFDPSRALRLTRDHGGVRARTELVLPMR
jgi:protocatechuate 3,4-dioxygenase beta subunit